MPKIHTRPATPSDVPLILTLIHELAEYERAPAEAVATEELLQGAMFSAHPACEALVGEVDGAAQGFALYFHNFSTWKGRRGLYLEDLFVRPGARGVGLGKALFVAVAKIAAERGCPRMEWAVLDWNTPAIEFYRAMGAIAMEEWTTYRLKDEALRNVARS